MNCLVCVIFDLFLAGSETTSTTLMWAVINMMRNEEVQKRVQDELDTVVGRGRLPTLQVRSAYYAKCPPSLLFLSSLPFSDCWGSPVNSCGWFGMVFENPWDMPNNLCFHI